MNIAGFDWSNKRVLVTGASGFKGSWLCAALLRLGAKVYGTVRNHQSPTSAFTVLGLEGRIVAINADISDRQAVYDMVNTTEPDVIFHLAAKALVPVALRDPRRAFDININGTMNILEACRKLRVASRVLVCSTDHVFGDVTPDELPNGGFPEKSRVSYGGPYDTSKAAMELMTRCFHHTYWSELPAIGITRCANVFGYGDTNPRRIVPLFLGAATAKGVIPLKYRKSGRQFLHVTDAISGYIRAASSLDEGSVRDKAGRTPPHERSPFTPTFHFSIESYDGTDEPFIRMDSFASVVGSLFSARIDDSECVDYPANENRIQALNCRETRQVTGWSVQRPFTAALHDVGQWFLKTDSAHRQAMVDDDIERVVEALK